MKTNSFLIMTVTLSIISFAFTGMPATNYTDISSRVKEKPPVAPKKVYPGSYMRENEIKLRKLVRQYHACEDLSDRAKIKQEMKEILEEEFDKATELKNKQLENLDVRRRARRKREQHRERNKKDAVDARLKQLLKEPPKETP